MAAEYFACPAYGLTVTAKMYDPAIKEKQIQDACLQAWNVANSTVDSWQSTATDGTMWGNCPGAHEPQLTFKETFCLAFYGIIGAELLLYLLWHLYKTWRERGAHSLRQLCFLQPTRVLGSTKVDAFPAEGAMRLGGSDKIDAWCGSDDSGEVNYAKAGIPDGMALLRGFDGSIPGLLLYILVLLTTVGWIVLLAIIVSDYYGKIVGGLQFGLLANSNTSMIVFIFVWHVAALWLGAVLAARPRLRNYFRIECPLAQATVVQVEERQNEEVLTQGAHNKLTALVSRMRINLVAWLGLDITVDSYSLQRSEIGDRPFIEHRCARYMLCENGRFEAATFVLGTTRKDLMALGSGLTTGAAQERASWLGENFIRVHVPPFPVALMNELFSYFYLYQMLCFWVWCYFAYYRPALIQMCIILLSALIKTIIKQRSECRIKSLAERRRTYVTKRDGVWVDLDSADLVPGDVIAVEPGQEMMCDGCMVRGEAVMDECSLTGEAMPVRKLCIDHSDTPFAFGESASKIYSVFAGTRIVQCDTRARPTQQGGPSDDDDEPLTQVLVLSTRTLTGQGKLLRRILYPAPQSFVFDEQLRTALFVLMIYGGICFGLSIWLMGHDVTSWFYGLFLISQVTAPLLPAALVAGQTVAAVRLRRQNIFCIDLPRILMAGKVRVFCADKTGTLSKDSLDYHMVQTIEMDDGGARFNADPESEMARLTELLQIGFATCHAVAMVDSVPVGNPVDVAQFQATGWRIAAAESDRDGRYLDTLLPPTTIATASGREPDAQRRVHIVRRHEFQHARQSMSVAVLDPATGHVHVFVKGSFERVKQLAVAESAPANYDKVTACWAKYGCYVLSLAHRDLGAVDLDSVARMSREELEDGCSLAALLLFRNQLKEDTAAAIRELREGGTRTVMVTGDAALTGVYIARECGMVDPHVRMLLGDIEATATGRVLVWRDTDSDEVVADVDSLLSSSNHTGTPTELAVTMAAFDRLVEVDTIRRYLLDIRIFARMSPQGKVRCVRLHMEKAVTAMCGDGGNDSGALRAAHVGLALSEAEASIVSPFSTSKKSIYSCVALLREGRAAVATSVAAYKFVVNYATTMAMLEITQFYFSVIVSQAVWISIDGVLTITLVIAITQLLPAKRLYMSRPTARLLGPHTLASIWGQTAINHAFLFGAIGLLFRQKWFRCHEFDSRDIDTSLWWLLADNFEAEVISIVCLFQFVNAAAVHNFGYLFRRPWMTNYLLVFLYCIYMSIISALALADPNSLGCLYRINCGERSVLQDMHYNGAGVDTYNSPIGHNVMPRRFRWTLWALCATNVVACLAYEKLVVLGPVGRLVKRWWRSHHSDGKSYMKL